MRFFFCIWMVMLLPGFSQGQVDQESLSAAYRYTPGLDLPVIIGSLGLNAYFLYAEPRVEKMETEEIFSLHRDQVYKLERGATYKWNESATRWSDITQTSAILLPGVLLLSPGIRRDYKEMALIFGETAALITGISGVAKITVQRKRPFVYNDTAPIGLKYRRNAKYSFFSGHTSISAAMGFAGASVYSTYHPDSPWRKWVWAGAITLPAVTGYLRYEAGKHYLTDVAAGYFVGALVGYFIPYLHRITPGRVPVRWSTSTRDGLRGLQLVYTF